MQFKALRCLPSQAVKEVHRVHCLSTGWPRRLVLPGLAAIGLWAACAQDAFGQVGELRPGTRVRVTAISQDLDGEVGTIRDVAGDGLSVHFGRVSRTVDLDLREIETLDVSVRRVTHRKRGTLIGLAIGASAGIVAGLAAGDDPPCTPTYTIFDPALLPFCDFVRQDAEDKAVFGAFKWGALGTLVGFAIGSSLKRDIWAPVEGLAPAFALSPSMPDGRLGVTLVVSLRLTN